MVAERFSPWDLVVWDIRASPRYHDRLTLIETRPNSTIKAPRMLIEVFSSLTSRAGISSEKNPLGPDQGGRGKPGEWCVPGAAKNFLRPSQAWLLPAGKPHDEGLVIHRGTNSYLSSVNTGEKKL